MIVGLPAVPVVCDCDVAEAARLSAGNRWRWCGRCDALDEHSEVRDEALVEVTAWNMLDAIGIVDLAGGSGTGWWSVALGRGVHIDDQLGDVGGIVLACLAVDDKRMVASGDD